MYQGLLKACPSGHSEHQHQPAALCKGQKQYIFRLLVGCAVKGEEYNFEPAGAEFKIILIVYKLK